MELIQQEERSHQSRKNHSLADRAGHDKRVFRLLEIREELGLLSEKTKQPQQPLFAPRQQSDHNSRHPRAEQTRCPICEAQVGRLPKHLNKSHLGAFCPLPRQTPPIVEENRALIPCPKCGQFVRKDHLQRHLTRRHGSSPSPPLIPSPSRTLIQCPICHLHIRMNRLQRHHILNHPEEKTGVPVEKLPFELLPPGSWDIEDVIAYYHREAKEFAREIQLNRLTAIISLGPIKCYVGTELWVGYVVFEFSESGRVVLECPVEGNATYVLSGDWKKMVGHSKFYLRTNFSHNYTKIVHKGDWLARVKTAL